MLIAVVVIVLVLAMIVVLGFNSLRTADQGVKKDWNNITTELQRRSELIPNLVEAVKQYASHERDVLTELVAARAVANSVTSDPAHAKQAAEAQEQVSATLGRLFALSENYPNLKASDNFRQLQAELTDTEDRIAASRKLYNSSVEHLNNKTRTFPTMLFVGLAGVTTAEYYTVPEEQLAELQKPVNVKDMF